MTTSLKKTLYTGLFTIILLQSGCEQPSLISQMETPVEITMDTTINSVAEVFSFNVVPVEGYGLVGWLNGTGSSECPPQIKAYLKQYILKQMSKNELDVENFVNSRDTAVVAVYGLLPGAGAKDRYFDVRVAALPGTQTTSIEGGWLYSAELKEAGNFGLATKVLANAEGPVFIDKFDSFKTNKKIGYILAGGMAIEQYRVNLTLRQPDYRVATAIRDRLNERFGSGIAKPVSPSQIELVVPAKYKEQKQRFVSLVKATYLAENQQVLKERVDKLVKELDVSENKAASELALETIGNAALGRLSELLNSSSEQVRLRAARCMLNLGSDKGLNTLRQIAMDKTSRYRTEALKAITTSARRNDASAISRRLLRDSNFNIRFAAYEQLRKLDDVAVTQRLIARNFYLEEISQTEDKAIFVSRSGQPRIVLFGAPIYCRENIFVQSDDGNITINAPTGQKHVSIIYKHPKRPDVIIQLQSSFKLGEIIQTLCEEPVKKNKTDRTGLGISYADMILLLKQMCNKGAVEAEFYVGSLPKIGPIVKE